MKQWWMAGVVLSLLPMGIASCDGSSGASSIAYSPAFGTCSQYTSCFTCTPAVGCGWCSKSDGTGMCATNPNECANAKAFNWTWDPSGCHVTADASVASVDAAEASTDSASGRTDVAMQSGDAGAGPDTAISD
jgi:hypothetical protein